ncbi:MAG: cellulase family glycosylhydrolase [Anaerolineae bacterium]|nr:cellulase family glycosylhydrolase [Anaerolineae bacterium]
MTHSRNNRWTLAVILIVVFMAGLTGIGLWARSDGTPGTPLPPSPTPRIPTDLAPDAVVDPPFVSLTYGIHAFLWWNESIRTFDLDNIRLMRFSHVKQRFSWQDIQPFEDEWHWDRADGVVNEVEYRGLELVARLDGPPDWAITDPGDPGIPPVNLDAWATYCGTLAARYQGRIAAYQVWNEPNLRREWLGAAPNAAGYVQLLAACSDAIRTADPNAVIISAGLAPTGTWLPDAIPDTDYLRLMYDAGASPHFDVLGLNAPGYKWPPTVSPDEAEADPEIGHRWMVFRHVEDMRGIMVAAGDGHKQVALLEVGWTTDQREDSTYRWHAVTQEQQADYLEGAYRYAAEHWRPWLGLMTTIYVADLDWSEDNEEWWWAINNGGFGADWGGRPAYYALSNMARWEDDVYTPPQDPSDPDAVTVDPLPPREGE